MTHINYALALAFQHFGQAGQGLGRVDHAGGVVGGVDQHTGGAGAEHLLQRLEIGLKVRHLRGHDGQFRTGASHIRPVFREVGGKGEHLFPRGADGPHSMGNGASSAGGGEDVLRRVGQAKLPFQLSGYGPAKGRVPLAGAVTMQLHRVGGSQQTGHSLGQLGRTGDAGVAQRIIKNIFGPDLGSPLPPIHKGLPDHAFVVQHPAIGLVEQKRVLLPGWGGAYWPPGVA